MKFFFLFHFSGSTKEGENKPTTLPAKLLLCEAGHTIPHTQLYLAI